MSNQKPDAFHNFGYFETYSDSLTGRVLGNMVGVTPEPGRKIGFNGTMEKVMTRDFVLNRGPKNVTVKASPKKPLKVSTILFPLTGRINWVHPKDNQ